MEHARRVRERERAAQSSAAQNTSAARVLRVRAAQSTVPDEPHVPLQDNWYAYEDKYTVRSEGYFDPPSEAVRADREGIMRGGGYVVEEAWERALRCAVAGLEIQVLSDASIPLSETLDSVMSITDGGVVATMS